MDVEFFGAAGEVTGSCHRVHAAGKTVLLDCGMIQGSANDEARNAAAFGFDPTSIDALVLSHAHIDHTGRVPLLVKRGFRGPIFTHPATIDLARIMLADIAHIAAMDAEAEQRHHPERAPLPILYTQADVDAATALMRPLEYRTAGTILPGVDLTLHDAGHILGSAIVELTAHEDGGARTLVFSGDLGQKGSPILCDPETIGQADLVLMESTYGDRQHRGRADTEAELASILETARRTRGNVVIPAFAVGRTQEILYFFAEHFDAWGLGDFRIFLDSPMAVRVTEVYGRHEELWDADARRLWAQRPHPLHLPNLVLSVSGEQSREINEIKSGAVIIAGSGMCTGGRIRHHLRHNLGRPAAQVVIVGYQARGTLGRLLVEGARSVRLFNDEIEVRASIHTVGGLSAHADQAGLVDWYEKIAAHPRVALVHGEDPARGKLADVLRQRYNANVTLSSPNLRLPV